MNKSKLLTIILFCTLSFNLLAQEVSKEDRSLAIKDRINEALHAMRSLDHKQIIVVPHRGLWGKPGVPETSLRAIKECYEAGYMFCEIDVVITKDRELVLSHDMQLNRTTDAPPTFTTYGGVHDPGNFFRSLNYHTETLNSVPNANGDIYPSFPALKDLHYKDRFGNITTEKLNTLAEAFDYCKGKELILALDVKAVNMADPAIKREYFEIFKIALELARDKGVLHQIIFKPGSSGQVIAGELKLHLASAGVWEEFAAHTNVILINIIGNAFPLATDKEYLDGWFAVPSLIAVEHIYKNPEDGLLVPIPDLGNLSVIEYTKKNGRKTGIFHPWPTDASGTPVGRGRWTPGYIIQADEDYSDANAWYVRKQPEGTYLIRNLDTNGYLSVYGSYFDYGVYIVQSYTIGGASERWVAKKIQERIYYLTSLCSGMNIGMRYDSKEPGEYVIQTNSTDLSYQWVFFPEDFSVGEKLHGFYKIQDMTTSKYLGVEGYTTSKDANIVAQDNADDPAGWWSIEQVEGGPYILKNVNSQFCVAVENRSSQNGAHLVQTSVPERMRGHCFWRMIKTDGGFYFRNVFDGMFLTIKDGYFVIQKVPVHGSGHPDTNMSWRLIPVEYGVSN